MNATIDKETLIQSQNPADIWAEGYPIGNGRVGAMIACDPLCERVSLNHDRLWRRNWRWGNCHLSQYFPTYQQLCLEERFVDAVHFIKDKVPHQGTEFYVNRFAPAGDLGILSLPGPRSEYHRQLDLERGIVTMRCRCADTVMHREYFASRPDNVVVVRLENCGPRALDELIYLYRYPDETCEIQGEVAAGELRLRGKFQEGGHFAITVRILPDGDGKSELVVSPYQPPSGKPAQKPNGFTFDFRELPHPRQATGIAARLYNTRSATILIAVSTDRDQPGTAPEQVCAALLRQVKLDYAELKARHIADYRTLYHRVRLDLPGTLPEDTAAAVQRVHDGQPPEPKLYELCYQLGRYLAIAAGRPQNPGTTYKAPINLQGLWNEDHCPAWDCDYHTDLNLEMCYWSLGGANLAELGNVLVEWAWNLMPECRRVARDIYGLPGVFFPCCCDDENPGNCDDLGVLATGTSAWVGQMLYQVWEYNRDPSVFRERIYPVLKEMGRFFAGLLREDSEGRLVTAPSGSPENCPIGYPVEYCMLSRMSTFDMELLRELFENLIAAANFLEVDSEEIPVWSGILARLPLPTVAGDGRLQEWLHMDYAVRDPGHRHRSHLVGILPGRRITPETTPELLVPVEKALALRHQYSNVGSCALDVGWDAGIFARLHQGDAAEGKLREMLVGHAMGNLLNCLCDWREGSKLRWFGGRRIFQIESSFAVMGAIQDCLLSDRGGVITVLPALPSAWRDGNVSGLRTVNGFDVTIRWARGRWRQVELLALRGGICRLKLPGEALREFATQAQQRYCFHAPAGAEVFASEA